MSTKRKLKKMVSVLFILGCFFIGNTKCKGADLEYISQETANYAVQERGYDLPVDEVVKEEAIEDCKNVMNQMKAIYQKADKGTSSNVVVSETVMEEMQEVLKEKNVPVITSAPYSNMANYSKMEEFLFRAEQDLTGDIVLYRINRDGGIERLKFNYDGTDMYLLAVKAVWGMNDNPSIVYVSYTRIEEWKYTEKGWFGYTLCVPKYPEVSEAVDGSSMIRIKPLSGECREENNVEPIELVTRGSLHEKDGVFYLKYDEYYEDLEKPARNLLKFDKLGLDLTKKGEVSAAMSFRPGETREAFYSTPVGMMNISILTEGYQLVETEKGLGLVVVYVMDYGNECVSFNVLRITVEWQKCVAQ